MRRKGVVVFLSQLLFLYNIDKQSWPHGRAGEGGGGRVWQDPTVVVVLHKSQELKDRKLRFAKSYIEILSEHDQTLSF